MAELPFGSNPFSAPASAEASNPRPTASFLARQTIPPAVAPTPRVGKSSKRKERTHTNVPVGEAGKKTKNVDSSATPPIFSTFSDLAQANFKAESVNDWKSRNSVEADFYLHQDIGEVYVHGLDRLNAKDKEISELKAVITKYRTNDISRGQELASLKKKGEEEAKLHKEELEKLRTALEEVKSDLKSEEELHSAAVSSIQAKFEESLADKRRELSEA